MPAKKASKMYGMKPKKASGQMTKPKKKKKRK